MLNREIKKISIEPDHAQELFKLAAENRQFEIELLWKRTTIFWGFSAALFIGVATVIEHSPQLSFVLSSLGIVFSWIWTLSNRASKAWQESWEIKSSLFYREFNPTEDIDVYTRVDPNSEVQKIYSVSQLLIMLSDFVVIFWLGMCVYLFPLLALENLLKTFPAVDLSKHSGVIFFVFCLGYCGYVFLEGKSGAEKMTEDDYKRQRSKSKYS